MARQVTTVEAHPARAAIIQDLVDGLSTKKVSEKHGVPVSAVNYFVQTRLKRALVEAEAKQALDTGSDVRAALMATMDRVRKLYDACDEYLSDPHDPGRYELGPRAHEVMVVYYIESDEEGRPPRREKAPLDELLQRIGEAVVVDSTRHAVTDPRKLILDTAVVLTKQLEVIGRLLEDLPDPAGVSVTMSEAWAEIQAIVVEVLRKYPEAYNALAARLALHQIEAPRPEGGKRLVAP